MDVDKTIALRSLAFPGACRNLLCHREHRVRRENMTAYSRQSIRRTERLPNIW